MRVIAVIGSGYILVKTVPGASPRNSAGPAEFGHLFIRSTSWPVFIGSMTRNISVLSRQRTCLQRMVIEAFPLKCLVNELTSSYLLSSNEGINAFASLG